MKTQEKKRLEFKKKNVTELTNLDAATVIGGINPKPTTLTRFTPPFCDAVAIIKER